MISAFIPLKTEQAGAAPLSKSHTGVQLDAIESLRGIAALMVVFYHLAEYLKLPLPSSLEFVRSHFALGAPLFYALSGFVLALGYAGRLESRAEVLGYYTRRLFRIAPLFYALMAAWMLTSWIVWDNIFSSQILFLNMAFLFGLVPGAHGSIVFAGWSVGVEMIFYLIFPVLIMLLPSVRATIAGFLAACILSAAVHSALMTAGLNDYAYANLATQLPFFVAGVLCYRIWQQQQFSKHAVVAALLIVSALAFSVCMVVLPDLYVALWNLKFGAAERNIWAVVFAVLILSVCFGSNRILGWAPLRRLGQLSFSIYLTHPLIMLIMIKTDAVGTLSTLLGDPGYVFALGSAATVLLVTAVSMVTYRLVEVPGIALGRELAGQIQRGEDISWLWVRIQRWLSAAALPALRVVALTALVFSAYAAIRYAEQPLVDLHAFRQTQTALTAYWMLQEGWQLAYQTPVAGFPWSIPFEFPIYQGMTAVLAWTTGFDLSTVGRLVSYVFLVACAWPAFALRDRLGLNRSAPWIFCALLWSSPLYVYWGRSFLMETAATFFAFACLPYALDVIRGERKLPSVLPFLFFATASVLQKSTTAGPVLLFLFLCAIVGPLRQHGPSRDTLRRMLPAVGFICLPLVVGLAWAGYSDQVKQANAFGQQLTSDALVGWNFGNLAQRVDFAVWRVIVWERVLATNSMLLTGAVLVLASWFMRPRIPGLGQATAAAAVLFVLPVLIFTNLHAVHEYYQIACAIFLLAAIAVTLAAWLPQVAGNAFAVPAVALALVLSNMSLFEERYGKVVAADPDTQDSPSAQAYRVSRFLREHTPPGSGLAVFGQEYSSEVAFHSQRKTITVPPWFKEYRQVWTSPEKYLGNVPLAGIVLCPPGKDFPTSSDMRQREKDEAGWARFRVEGCDVLLKTDATQPKDAR